MTPIVFISHASSDRGAAEEICRAFEDRKLACFIAPRDILPGRNYGEAIALAIEGAQLLVLVLSASAGRSEHVLREVELAARYRVRVLPFRIGPVSVSKALDYFLAGAQYFDASSDALDRNADLLAERAARLLGSGLPTTDTDSAPGSTEMPALIQDMDVVGEQLVGTTIDRFRLQRLLGRGGSGFAFAAWDSRFNKPVCIKLFYPAKHEMPNTSALCRASVKALASLEHPGIISIVDFGDYRARWRSMWIAMELVGGQNLAEWTRGDHTLGRRLDVAIGITDALQAAHTHNYVDDFGLSRTGVYHGDLKPANVLLRPGDSPVLLDFMLPDLQRTLAAADDGLGRADQPVTGVMGTAGFMAPEQEQYGLVSPQSDIYSLGMTFSRLFAPDDSVSNWFMTPGRAADKRPFLSRWLTRGPASSYLNAVPRTVASVPEDLVRLIRSMLEPEPKARPAGVAIVHRVLGGIRAAG